MTARDASTGTRPKRTANGPAKKSRAEIALDRFHEEAQIDQAYDAKMLLRIWPFVRPHLRLLVASMSLLVIVAALAVANPLVMRIIVRYIGEAKSVSELTPWFALVAGMMIVGPLIQFPQIYLMQLAGARAMADLRRAVFVFLHSRRLGFFDRTPVGRLVTRVTNDVDAINEMFASGALNALGDFIRLLAIIVIMMRMNAQMSLLAFVAVPPVALGVMWTRRRIRDAYRAVRTKTARMNAYLNEQISGISVVQAYAREDRSAAEFDDINLGYRDANYRSILFESALDAAIETVASLCVATVLWYASAKTGDGKVAFEDVFAFFLYIDMFFGPIRDLSARFTLVQSAMTGAERVFELFENKDVDCPEAPAAKAKESDSAFELEHVDFEYKPGAPILRDVSIAAKKGEKIALVGATGAGKSTVASILLRLYEIKSGVVRVGGRDVKSIPRSELRSMFAVVPQDVFLFPGTVATNIAAGDAVPDRARVERALERIDALDLFKRRDGGLDGKVLERGNNFSAGERQLIAFARALYRDPPILVFDEATANVDSDTEARLQRALDGAMKGRTALIIAHRLSTIKAVDRIVVFHKGMVVEQGTRDELLARQGGFYAQLHALQFKKEQVEKSVRPVTEAAPPG